MSLDTTNKVNKLSNDQSEEASTQIVSNFDMDMKTTIRLKPFISSNYDSSG